MIFLDFNEDFFIKKYMGKFLGQSSIAFCLCASIITVYADETSADNVELSQCSTKIMEMVNERTPETINKRVVLDT
jgi:hypothetical protein